MKKSLITIVIPFYNEERNIQNCLDNLIAQTLSDFKVILVNDGSTDLSMEIIENYQENNKLDMEVYTQDNQGAAEAKKTGIKFCRTDFVMILDCDDLISSDTIEKIQHEIVMNSPDLVLLQLNSELFVNGHIETVKFKFFTEEKSFTGYEGFVHSIDGWGVHASGCYRKELFLKSYYDYEQYNVNRINYLNNDEVITRINYINAKSVKVIDSIYTYKFNENSTTKKLNSNRFKIIYNSLILCDFIEKNHVNLKDLASRNLVSSFWGVHKYYRENKNSLKNQPVWKSEIQEFYKLIGQKNMFSDLDIKRKIQYTLLFTLYRFLN